MERRDFLQLTAAGLASALSIRPRALLAAQQSAVPAVLNALEWAQLEVLCELLLPPVNGVGTREAGCVNFIDKTLANEDASSLPVYRESLAALDAYARTQGTASWRSLEESARIASLEAMEDGLINPWPDSVDPAVFFGTLRFHMILGFLAAPKHGGNRQQAGWQAIGFPGHLHDMGGITDAEVAGREE
jgi:hypothetical protein